MQYMRENFLLKFRNVFSFRKASSSHPTRGSVHEPRSARGSVPRPPDMGSL